MLKFFCKHKWDVIRETITESHFEHTMNILKKNQSGNRTIPGQLCCPERKHIQIVTCSKCGTLKRFVTSI